mgnify:FL=1|jgi:hypothetical protein
MGRGDRRHSMKMRQREARNQKKEREARQVLAAKQAKQQTKQVGKKS